MLALAVYSGSFAVAGSLFCFAWRVVSRAVKEENAIQFEDWERI
jgi:hypothetical protein